MQAEQIMNVWRKASVPALNRAGLALKQFSGLDFAVTESDVRVVSWSEMAHRLKRSTTEPLYTVHLKALGLFEAHLLMVFSDTNSQRLVSALMGEGVDLPLDDMGLSALAEVGNVVGTAFLNVFSDLFNSAWEPTTPQVELTSTDGLIDEISPRTQILLSEALFQVTGEEVWAEIVVVPTLN